MSPTTPLRSHQPWRRSVRLLLAGATLLSAAVIGTPAYANPPPWAPAHGQRARPAQQYRYVYYPQQQVYYAPATRQWFWLSGGGWHFGLTLPSQYQGYVNYTGVPVLLHSRRPYVEHVYVEQHYGRPWRAKHNKYNKYKRHEKYKNDKHQRSHQHRDRDRHGHRN